MLVVPTISLLDGQAIDHTGRPLSDLNCSFGDPLKMALLWRVQNAKVVHLVDGSEIDGISDELIDLVSQLSNGLDIPLQLESRFNASSAQRVLASSCVSRIVIRAEAKGSDYLSSLIEEFGASRICIRLAYPNRSLDVAERQQMIRDHVSAFADMKCRRIILFDADANHDLAGHDRSLAASVASDFPRVRFSAMGGIGSFKELKLLELAVPRNVDSVVIGRALYENRFPCQQLWCWHQKDAVDLSQFSTASLKPETGE